MVATPSAEGLRTGINVIEEVLGNRWIHFRVERWSRLDCTHPLVNDFRYALRSLKAFTDGDENALHNEHVLRVQRLGQDLVSLEHTTLNWDELRKRLRNTDEAEKVIYEIQIAGAYLRRRHQVTLHGAAKGRDLTVMCGQDPIYVECKRKDRETERDLAARRIWVRLTEETLSLMKRKQVTGLVYIRSKKDPSGSDIDQVITKVEEALEQFRVGSVDQDLTCSLNSGANWYRISFRDLTAGGYMPKIAHGIPVSSMQTSDELLSYLLKLVARLRRGFETGRSQVEVWPPFQHDISADKKTSGPIRPVRRFNSFQFAFADSDDQRDYVRSALQTLVEARKRLPASGPGIVYMDIPSHHDIPVDERLEHTGAGLKSQLRRENARINAVVLTNTSPSPNPALTGRADELVTSTYTLYHDAPRTALPQKFSPTEGLF